MSSVVLNGQGAGGVRSGFFGKLPARRDFVTGNLPGAITEPWHDWLVDGLVRSRELIGDDWADAYLNLPVWRLAFSGGLCGDGVLAGVMIPNLDKVGRHFPLLIGAVLPADVGAGVVSVALADWYEAAEALALSSLEPGFVFEEFERRVGALPIPQTLGGVPFTAGDEGLDVQVGEACGWKLPTPPDGSPASAYAGLLDSMAFSSFGRYSVWWTAGSDRMDPALVVYPGLPSATAFAALLDGRWSERGWGVPPVGTPGPASVC